MSISFRHFSANHVWLPEGNSTIVLKSTIIPHYIPIVMVSFTRQEKTYIPLYPRLYPHDIPIMIVKSPLVLKSTIISESLVLCWGLLGWLRWDPATARPWYLCWVIACAADHGDVLPAACLTTKWKTAWGPALGRLQQKRHETSDMLEYSPRVG